MVKRYAGLHCNDVEVRIKSLAITIPTWANQMRLLKLNLQSVAAVIGQGLIAALLPAIKLLNKFMEKLMQAAKVFRDFMYVLFGKKIESNARGTVDDMADTADYMADLSGVGDSAEDAADGIEDTADSMDDATSSAKKLKKALSVLPFDQLNQLTGNLDNLSETKKKKDKDKKKGDEEDVKIPEVEPIYDDNYIKKQTEPINKWAAAIRKAFLDKDWEGLGKVIAKMINKGLRKIYDEIVAITPKVEKALRAFAQVFNSFVKWLDWDLLGRTIGTGVNLITRAINALTDPAKGINFVELGRKLSTGFRGLVNEIDWTGLGNAFGNLFMVSWRIFEGFVDDMWRRSDLTGLNGWQELGRSLGTGINGLFDKIDFGAIGNSLAMGFNGVFLSLKNFTQTVEWNAIADNISSGLTNAIEGIHPVEAAVSLGQFVTDLLGAMLRVAENTPWHTLGEKIGDFLINIPWRTIIGQVFGIIENVFGGLISGLGGKILNQFPQIANAMVVGTNTAFAKLNDFTKSVSWDEIATNISSGLNTMIHGIDWAENGRILSDFVIKLLDTFLRVAKETDWEALGQGIGDFISNIDWSGIFSRVFEIVKESIGGVISGFAETTAGKVSLGLVTAFGLMELAGIGLSVGNNISKELTGESLYAQIFNAITGEGGIISTIKEHFGTGFSGIFGEEGLLATVSTGATSLVTRIGDILGTIGSVIFSPTGLLIAGIALGAALIIMNWDSVAEVFSDFWENILVPLGEFVSTAFTAVWEDILSPALKYLGETVLPVLSDTFGDFWNNVLVPLGSFIGSTFGPIFALLGKILGELWKNVLVPLAQFVGTVFAAAFEVGAAVLNNIVIPIVGSAAKAFQFLGEYVLKPLITFVGGIFTNTLTEKFKTIGDKVERIKDVFKGLIEFVTGVFEGDWKKAWGGVKKVFEGVWGGLADTVKRPINAIIGFINKMVSGMATGVNSIGKMLNSLNIQIPDWVPGIGGGRLSFNIPTWTPGTIPYLAQGGVLKRGQVGILEGNGAEAVVPLERNRRWISKVSEEMSRNNYAYSGGVDKENIVDAIVEGVVTAVMMNQGNQPPIRVDSYVELRTENETLARAVAKGQQSIDYRTNPTPQFG